MTQDPEQFGLAQKSEENVKIDVEIQKTRIREVGDMRKVLSLVEGRRVVYKQLSESGIFNASFTQNANLTAFNEGRRDRGLALLTLVMEADSNVFYQMHREHVSELKSKQKENKEE